MRGGFDRLVKEIDTLTYNARSSLNAMIRSTIAAGTSNGFKAIRVGNEILLTRIDIYKLDKFYKQWEESNYDIALVDSILLEVDGRDALIKHSKILYLNNDTIGEIDNGNYWVGLIKISNNPKLISNSAPIPINIRTPIFDENMATTKYNQDETYLFPFSYYSVDLLGYSGDAVNHHMDGLSWTITADNYISMDTDAFSTGGVNSSDTRKTKARRNHEVDSVGNALEVTYSTANGYATQARAKYSHASGFGSIVPRGAVSGVAIGDRLLSTENYAVTIGGTVNKAIAVGSGVFAGTGNVSAGVYSAIVGGINNSVGSATDTFKLPLSDSNSSTCITVSNTCESSETGVYAGKNVIAINSNVSSRYEIGDTVAIHTLTVFSDTGSRISYWETNGDGFKTQYFTITSVEYLNPSAYPTNVNKGYTLITLSADLAGDKVDGGSITRVKNKMGVNLGYASVAMNNSNIAIGANQTVIGKYNYPNYDALFVIGNSNNGNLRSNVFEVYDDGICIYGTPFNSIQTSANNMSTYSTTVYHQFNYIGIYSKVKESNLTLNSTYSALSVGDYIGVFQSNIDASYDLMLSSYNSPLIITSGINRDYTNVPLSTDILVSSESDLLLEASSYIKINSDNACLISSGDTIELNWVNSLKLYGDTFGALPTTDEQYSHYISYIDINTFTENGVETSFGGLIKSGFYDIWNSYSGNEFTRGYSDIDIMESCQLLNIGSYSDFRAYAWKLMFPTLIDSTGPISHIGVMYNETDRNGTETSTSKSRTPRYLAYTDECGYANLYGGSAEATVNVSDIVYSIEYDSGSKRNSIKLTDTINSLIDSLTVSVIGQIVIIKLSLNVTIEFSDDSGDTLKAIDTKELRINMRNIPAFNSLDPCYAYNDVYLGSGTGGDNPMVYFAYESKRSLMDNKQHAHCITVKPPARTFRAIMLTNADYISTTMIGVKR